jgi:hypothetical protein
MNMNALSANEQWRSRPADQRFTSLTDLAAHTQGIMDHSAAKVVASRQLTADIDDRRLVIRGPSGVAARPTHYAFGQLAQLAGAPAGYLRGLPNELVVDNMNYGLHVARDVEDVGVLLHQNGGPVELQAATGPNYGRIWNARIAAAMVEAFGDGRTGTFRVPGEFGAQVDITKENTTLYASDRDMWAFLADETKSVKVTNRRHGQIGNMATGIVVGNSDVGAGRFWLAQFAFDFVCCNRIIWGFRDLEEFAIRHTASAPLRFMSEVVPMLKEVAQSNASLSEAKIVAAQAQKIDDLDKFLAGRKFTRSQVSGIKSAFKEDEGYELSDAASIWNTVVGVTAYARGLQYQDARVDVERAAGKILQLAA